MKYRYYRVPRMGTVELSRHAQERALNAGITDKQVEDLLFEGEDIPDGNDVMLRNHKGIRAVIMLYPVPNRKSRLVKTIFKLDPKERIK